MRSRVVEATMAVYLKRYFKKCVPLSSKLINLDNTFHSSLIWLQIWIHQTLPPKKPQIEWMAPSSHLRRPSQTVLLWKMFSLSMTSVSIHELPTSVTALVKNPVRLYVQPSVQGTVSKLSRSFWLRKSSSEVGCQGQGEMWSLILGTTAITYYPYHWSIVHQAFAQAIPFKWDKPFPQLLPGEFFSIAVIEMCIHRAVVLRHIEHQDRGEDSICNQDIEGEAHEKQGELVPVSPEIGVISWHASKVFCLPIPAAHMFKYVVKVLYFLRRFHHFAPASLQERTQSDEILSYVTPSIPNDPTSDKF